MSRSCEHPRQVFGDKQMPCAWPGCKFGVAGDTLLMAVRDPIDALAFRIALQDGFPGVLKKARFRRMTWKNPNYAKCNHPLPMLWVLEKRDR